MAKFQEGDKVLIVDSGAGGHFYQLDPSFIGQVGVILNIIEYPVSGMTTDVLVEVDGGVTAFELPNLELYVEEAKVSGETAVKPTPRVNYLYVVEDDDGAYIKTFDRAYAREVKAELGGKKAGVIITAYAAVKEIR